MGFLSKKGEGISPLQAASRVRDEYDAKITRFLHRVNAAESRWSLDNDLLGRLFSWGEQIWLERENLQTQLSQVEGKFNIERNRLQNQLSQAEQTIKTDRKKFQAQFTESEENKRAVQNKLQKQLLEAEDRIGMLRAELADFQRKINRIEEENDSIKAQHREETDKLVRKYESVTKKEKVTHGREVKKLVGQLLVNQDDNVGWADDKLKYRYQQLQSLISSLVSPRNKEYRIPAESSIGNQLDPTGFLARTSRAKAHFLLQSIIWTILYDQFFYIPLGFGVFGDGEGQTQFSSLVLSWVELLGKTSSDETQGDKLLWAFRESKVANTWRSATFQCINEALVESSWNADTSNARVSTFISNNVDQAVIRITGILGEITKLSGSSPTNELDDVQQIAVQARDLALQFGLHSAQLQLFMPKHGDEVQIGEDIYDCEEGDCDRGEKHIVDLVTLPGLQKVGDGRVDIQSKRTLVPCEIYPK